LNRYTYGNLDPINHVDPDGNQTRMGTPGSFIQVTDTMTEAEYANAMATLSVIASYCARGGRSGFSIDGFGFDPEICEVPPEAPPEEAGIDDGDIGSTQGAVAGRLDVFDFSMTNASAIRLQNSFRRLGDYFAQGNGGNCGNWLASGGKGVADAFTGLLDTDNGGAGGLAVGTMMGANAVTGTAGTSGLPPNWAGITVYNAGVFFTANSDANRAFLMLHELAHYMGVPGFVADGNSQALQDANNLLIGQNCGAVLTDFGANGAWRLPAQ
jgi:hypothetical protein